MVLSAAVSTPALLVCPNPAGYVSLPDHSWELVSARRWVMVGRGASALPQICSFTTPHGTLHLFVRDSPAAAVVHPLSLSTLRAALSVGGRRRLLRHWTAPVATDPISLGPSRVGALPPQVPGEALVDASFTDLTAARIWQSASQALSSALRDTSWGYSRRLVAALPAAQSVMLPALAHSRCSGVQRVLDQAQVPQPDVAQPTCAVYALCSPFLSKPYVGAVGF